MRRREVWSVASLVAVLALAACGNNEIDQSLSRTATAGEAVENAQQPGANEPLDSINQQGAATATATGEDEGTTATATGGQGGAAEPAGTTVTGANGDPTGNVLTLSITNSPSEPLYSQGVMQAPIGSPIVVQYNNPSDQPHNWVLVQPGQEQAVADAAEAKNGDPSNIEGVIAWSETITGSTTNIEVPPLPETGGYPYICTVPGHYEAGHKGALNVR
ncbi:MAG: plastocyanin/azurin family copper-binding protein [Chloroflexota bacterium]|nr:plastocyanin/azurin family copper-binding protein [Chloroflexota bacterium]PLS80530.1 MAG: hypothetical protein CYG59_07640 [Chloroflexota bacterium]